MIFRNPAVLISCGLTLGLSAAAALLLHLYSQASARRFAPALPALPSATQLLAATRQFDPSLASPDLQLLHEARPLPRSGLLLQDVDGRTFDAYRSNSVPTTYLLDAEAKVAGSVCPSADPLAPRPCEAGQPLSKAQANRLRRLSNPGLPEESSIQRKQGFP